MADHKTQTVFICVRVMKTPVKKYKCTRCGTYFKDGAEYLKHREGECKNGTRTEPGSREEL